MKSLQVGVLSCSGEECLGGTLSRLATRKVMEELNPNVAVTLCLPLFIAGGQEERDFAKQHPVITVEGCNKCCSKAATEKFSGKISDIVLVEEIIGKEAALSKTVSARYLTDEQFDMVDKIATEISKKIDALVQAEGEA